MKPTLLFLYFKWRAYLHHLLLIPFTFKRIGWMKGPFFLCTDKSFNAKGRDFFFIALARIK